MRIMLFLAFILPATLAVDCNIPQGPLPPVDHCEELIDMMGIAIVKNPGINDPHLYGRRQENTDHSIKIPRIWAMQGNPGPGALDARPRPKPRPARPNWCGILISTPDNDLWAEETLKFSELIVGGFLVLDRCLRPMALLGRCYPGRAHKVFTSLERTATAAMLEGMRVGNKTEYVVTGAKGTNGTATLVSYDFDDVKQFDHSITQ